MSDQTAVFEQTEESRWTGDTGKTGELSNQDLKTLRLYCQFWKVDVVGGRIWIIVSSLVPFWESLWDPSLTILISDEIFWLKAPLLTLSFENHYIFRFGTMESERQCMSCLFLWLVTVSSNLAIQLYLLVEVKISLCCDSLVHFHFQEQQSSRQKVSTMLQD